jgi:alkylation response protein AidB-like acyl-CoA dehydrogenase
LGWRASDTAEIAFDNVEIQRDLMGEEKGFPILCNTLLGKVDYGYKRAC